MQANEIDLIHERFGFAKSEECGFFFGKITGSDENAYGIDDHFNGYAEDDDAYDDPEQGIDGETDFRGQRKGEEGSGSDTHVQETVHGDRFQRFGAERTVTEHDGKGKREFENDADDEENGRLQTEPNGFGHGNAIEGVEEERDAHDGGNDGDYETREIFASAETVRKLFRGSKGDEPERHGGDDTGENVEETVGRVEQDTQAVGAQTDEEFG